MQPLHTALEITSPRERLRILKRPKRPQKPCVAKVASSAIWTHLLDSVGFPRRKTLTQNLYLMRCDLRQADRGTDSKILSVYRVTLLARSQMAPCDMTVDTGGEFGCWRVFPFIGVLILPRLRPICRRREFATSVTVGSTPIEREGSLRRRIVQCPLRPRPSSRRSSPAPRRVAGKERDSPRCVDLPAVLGCCTRW
jgi:hypothetical protein